MKTLFLFRFRVVFFSTAALCNFSGLAATDADGGAASNVVLVTARGYEQSSSKIPGGTAVIGRHDIERRRDVSVSDAMSVVPGVSRSSDGVWGSDVSIRGLSRNSVVLLVDGVVMNTSPDIAARFGLVDPADVERIEILKGPLSSLYGSGSIGGVVNVITKSGRFTGEESWRRTVDVDVQDNPSGSRWRGGVHGSASNWWCDVGVGYRNMASYEDGDGRKVRNSQFEDSSANLASGFRLSRTVTLAVNAQYMKGDDIGVPGTGTAPLPAAADVTYDSVERRMLSVSPSWRPESDWFKASVLQVYRQDVERHVVLDHFPAVNPVARLSPQAEHSTDGARWWNEMVFGSHHVTAGVDAWERQYEGKREKEFRDGHTTTDKPLPDSSYRITGIYAQDDWDVAEGVTISAGGRSDDIRVTHEKHSVWPAGSEDDRAWNMHAGLAWMFVEDVSFKLIGARGYRAPSLEERFQYLELAGGITKYGNPDLKPEQSKFVEAGVQWAGDRMSMEVSLFRNMLEDMISETVVDASTRRNENIAEAELRGVEGEWKWAPADMLEVFGTVSYVRGDNEKTGQPLRDIPPLKVSGGLEYGRKEGGWGRAEVRHAARQDRVPTGVSETPGATTVDLRLGWTVAGRSLTRTFYVGANNLFDVTCRDALSTARGAPFNEPGRTLLAGCRLEF